MPEYFFRGAHSGKSHQPQTLEAQEPLAPKVPEGHQEGEEDVHLDKDASLLTGPAYR